ncbi:MAG TPA: 30S ribosomal protein S7 [Candidatus Saccharimonadales bacterium]|nr:30S ribosomal protein S7 [Candidatus Saccharimonadales bacterium]
MRHAKVKKRIVNPDTLYNNVFVAKLINYIMRDGKKTVAQAQVYNALEILSQKGEEPLKGFEKAMQNIGPKVEVKARRIGGANYQVPVEVKHERRMALALRWLIEAARKRPNKEYHTFAEKLAAEILAAINNEGEAVRKRELALRQAEANKAFSHFRW